ncbi:MAG: tryptophan--tRNA ligase [bacterium]
MTRVLSGIQPTGELHIGNYFGMVRNAVRLQSLHDCFYCVVDYHAITADFNPQTLGPNTLRMAADLIACGIDPARCVFFVQSHVPEHTELAWIFNCFTSIGELRRMHQFKSKSKEHQDFVSAGLFDYPVLQAADILIYKADFVPVGEDQVQHLELTNDIRERFHSRVGCELFPEVKPLLSETPRIMSLADPTKKMSKSLGPQHYVGVFESPESINKKIRSAVTDVGLKKSRKMSPGVRTLFEILKITAPAEVYEGFMNQHKAGALKYSELKPVVFDHLMKELAPIHERRNSISESEVKAALKANAEKARAVASDTMASVRSLLGPLPA